MVNPEFVQSPSSGSCFSIPFYEIFSSVKDVVGGGFGKLCLARLLTEVVLVNNPILEFRFQVWIRKQRFRSTAFSSHVRWTRRKLRCYRQYDFFCHFASIIPYSFIRNRKSVIFFVSLLENVGLK